MGLLCVWLFTLGAKGAEIANVLALPVGIIGVALAALAYFYPPGQSTAARASLGISQKLKLFLIGACFAIVGIGGGVSYWYLIHKPDVNIKDRISRNIWHGMKAGESVTMEVLGTLPERSNLVLRFALENNLTVGDCIAPAKLEVVPIFDRKVNSHSGEAKTVRPGKEVHLNIEGALSRVQVKVTLQEPDPTCAITLRVTEAILYN